MRTFDLQFPARVGTQLKISLPNRGVPHGHPGRDVPVTFRAVKSYREKRWYEDCMRYYYVMEGSDGMDTTGVGYGRCVCFLEDLNGAISVVLRCYIPYNVDVAEGRAKPAKVVVDTFDSVTQLVPLLLCRLDSIESYVLVPESGLLNGGFILQDPAIKNKHWVVQGCREKQIFLNHNGY
jgi:hypothetical protein